MVYRQARNHLCTGLSTRNRPILGQNSCEHCKIWAQNYVPVSNLQLFDILGFPIGDYLFCSYVIASKCHKAQKLLFKLEEILVVTHK